MEDKQKLIDDQVYRITTGELELPQQISKTRLVDVVVVRTKILESRKLVTIILSTFIVTLILLTFLSIQLWYTSSIVQMDPTLHQSHTQASPSTWVTSYDLPHDVPLLELHPRTFNFSLGCPVGRFALVLHLESPITTFEKWMLKCGGQVAFFRMNGDPEIEDVDQIIKYVPTAQYMPIKASLYVAKWDDILSDPHFQASVQFEGSVLNSLTISGYLTPQMMKAVLEIAPFIEELTIQGSEVCSSLVSLPKRGSESYEISWSELRKLRVVGLGECIRTYEFIDSSWKMPTLHSLEIKESDINEINTQYIENIIDNHRITKVNFKDNKCSEYSRFNHQYICEQSSLLQLLSSFSNLLD